MSFNVSAMPAAAAPIAMLHAEDDDARIQAMLDRDRAIARQVQKTMCHVSTIACEVTASSAQSAINNSIATSAPTIAPYATPCVNASVQGLSQSAQIACRDAIQSQSCHEATTSSVSAITGCFTRIAKKIKIISAWA